MSNLKFRHDTKELSRDGKTTGGLRLEVDKKYYFVSTDRVKLSLADLGYILELIVQQEDMNK